MRRADLPQHFALIGQVFGGDVHYAAGSLQSLRLAGRPRWSAGFDTGDYPSHYLDVATAHINPLTHFLAFGQAEGRSLFADGHFG
jgi:hypothetical protein